MIEVEGVTIIGIMYLEITGDKRSLRATAIGAIGTDPVSACAAPWELQLRKLVACQVWMRSCEATTGCH